MLNLNELKKRASEKLEQVGSGTIAMCDLFKNSGTFVLKEEGFHAFKISTTELTDNTLTLKGQTMIDEETPTDENFYTLTLRLFGDGEIFRQQYRDILEQLNLPLNSDFSVLPQFKDKNLAVKVVKNARGFAQYYLNIDFIEAELIKEMNTAKEN
jgi:hypothetical protein